MFGIHRSSSGDTAATTTATTGTAASTEGSFGGGSIGSRSTRRGCRSHRWETPSPRSTSTRRYRSGEEPQTPVAALPRSMSARRASGYYTTSTATTVTPATGMRASTTMFFCKKPPPMEMNLVCTLEELYTGCKKEVRYVRDAIGKHGKIVKKEEVETVQICPGWKEGTKVTFEEKGDEAPGSIPSDVVFLISEQEHPYFRRVGNDLELVVEIPLVNALSPGGWSFAFLRLDGERMELTLRQDELVHPNYESVVAGEGMPIPNVEGAKGNLRVKYAVVFPTRLSKEQRAEMKRILADCCY